MSSILKFYAIKTENGALAAGTNGSPLLALPTSLGRFTLKSLLEKLREEKPEYETCSVVLVQEVLK